MDDIGHMVGDHLGLGFLDNLGEGAATSRKQGYASRMSRVTFLRESVLSGASRPEAATPIFFPQSMG
jgi:hypothetical protein